MGASTIATAARPSPSKFIFRAVVGVLVLLLIVFLAFDFWFYRAVRAALPQVDGTIHLSGLAGPVTVTYDALGVPNIAAANLPDLFFAQGYVTAQDRLWQMDMTRRYASGDLAAVLGPEYVKLDREHRILGLRQVAERSVANMDMAQRAHFEAYAAGVNAYIAQHQKTLPLEFRFLTYFPHVWTVEDSVLVGLSMTEFLNHGLYKDELEKEKILAKLGPELTADLFVNSSWRDHPPGADTTSLENEIPGETTPDEEEDPAPKKKSNRVTPEEKQVPRLATLDPSKMVHHGVTEDTEVRFLCRLLRDLSVSVVNFHPQDDKDNGRLYGAPPSKRSQGRRPPSRLQQLGGLGRAHRLGKAAALERHAPRPAHSQRLVRGASYGGRLRRCRRDLAGRAFRHFRAQSLSSRGASPISVPMSKTSTSRSSTTRANT